MSDKINKTMKSKRMHFLNLVKKVEETDWFTIQNFSLAILILIIPLLLCFHPGIKPRWNSCYRRRLLNQFLQNLTDNKQINPQQFWLFRERYSPGTFKINSQAVGVFQTFRIIDVNPKGQTDLLFYKSPYLNSTDSLVPDNFRIQDLAKKIDTKEIIVQENNILLLRETTADQDKQSEIYELWFLLPIEEMKTANGFFDYTSSEMELIQDKLWLNHSIIKVSD